MNNSAHANHAEAERLRRRDDDLADELTRAPLAGASGAPCLVAQTTTVVTYPTSAQRFYACTPYLVTGTEAEGSAGSYTAAGAHFFALNLGSAVPVSGTVLAVTFVNNRWVFRYDA